MEGQMRCFPKCEVTRVAQITQSGKIFICLDGGMGKLAQRVSGQGVTESLILDYNPDRKPESANMRVPWINDAPNATAILLDGAEIELCLSTDPQDWSGAEPAGPTTCVAVHESGQYIRANGAHSFADFHPYYVNFETGQFVQRLAGYAAYVRSWRVDAIWDDGRRETLFNVVRGAIRILAAETA